MGVDLFHCKTQLWLLVLAKQNKSAFAIQLQQIIVVFTSDSYLQAQ